MSDQLEPCPFCGGKVVDHEDCNEDGYPTDAWNIMCEDCDLMTQANTPDRREAIESWNRRTSKPQTAAVLAELVDKLKEASPGQFNSYMNGFDVCLTVEDREAFLREQGVEP